MNYIGWKYFRLGIGSLNPNLCGETEQPFFN